MAGETYRDDLRARIEAFDALAGVMAASADDSHIAAREAA
jgi:hypothetical protein